MSRLLDLSLTCLCHLLIFFQQYVVGSSANPHFSSWSYSQHFEERSCIIQNTRSRELSNSNTSNTNVLSAASIELNETNYIIDGKDMTPVMKGQHSSQHEVFFITVVSKSLVPESTVDSKCFGQNKSGTHTIQMNVSVLHRVL